MSWLLASNAPTTSGTLYLVLPGTGNLPDLYRYDVAVGGAPENLTKTGGIAEEQPVVSPDGTAIAYYGLSAADEVELYVIALPDGLGTAVTTRTDQTPLHNGYEIDTSQPPRWSSDSAKLAFLARQNDGRGNAVELFIVSRQGHDLQMLPPEGNRVVSMSWLGPQDIAYTQLRGDGKAVTYHYQLTQLTPVPVPIATVTLSK